MRRLPRDFQAFVIAVTLTAAVMQLALSSEIHWNAWQELLLFMVLIGSASMFPIPDPRGGYITTTAVLFYVLLSVHGPGAALIVSGSGYAVGAAISRGWLPWRTVFNGAQMGISVALAGLVFQTLGGNAAGTNLLRHIVVPLTAAVVTKQFCNELFVSFYFSRRDGAPLSKGWITDIPEFLLNNLLSVPLAALLVVLYVRVHPLSLVLYLLSMPSQFWALRLYLARKRLYAQAVDSLVLALDANFPQGRGHARRVADLAVAIARRMRMSDRALETIELASLLHDVGMIGLDDPGSDMYDAGKRLRQHASIGASIVKGLPPREIANIVHYHHERIDGSGPEGLQERRIPLGAKVIAVAEEYDSMISGLFPHNTRRSPSAAVEFIQRESGTLFDPGVVAAFIDVVNSASWGAEAVPVVSLSSTEAEASR